ncbi:MAG: hypothetical protein WCP36_06530 [Methanomicrobiales archaeon]
MICCLLIGGASAAPYSIDITPVSAQAAPGGSITYNVMINAPATFTDPIDFSFDVSSAGYQTVINAGTYQGPYPRSFSYTLQIPSNLPGGINAKVLVNAKSGSSLVRVPLDISIRGAGGPVESIISAITSFINTIQSQISGLTK